MLATRVHELPEGAEWEYEVKWDGYRIEAVKDGSAVVGYFPPAVSEEEWAAAQAGTVKRGQKRGRVGKHLKPIEVPLGDELTGVRSFRCPAEQLKPQLANRHLFRNQPSRRVVEMVEASAQIEKVGATD